MKNKKALAVLLVVAMLFAGVSASVFAAAPEYFYDSANKTLTINGEGDIDGAYMTTLMSAGTDIDVIIFTSNKTGGVVINGDAKGVFLGAGAVVSTSVEIQAHDGCVLVDGESLEAAVEEWAAFDGFDPTYVSLCTMVQGTFVAPTCTEKGSQAYVCSECGAAGETVEVAIDPTAHNFPKVATHHVDPTCEEEGADYFLCTRCGDAKKAALDKELTRDEKFEALAKAGIATKTAIPALGHDIDMNDVDLEPTLFSNGTYYCGNCGESIEVEGTSILAQYNELILYIANLMYRLLSNIDIEFDGWPTL